MQYKIVEELSPDKLQESVQKELNDGWELFGGISSSPYMTEKGSNNENVSFISVQYLQALTKK